ncbi:uncharacterized protein RCC_04244 [Ramularia collo-cygni]|uniref:Serine aminopeptidase S33 domain-containing protein n=1 Tax=Ramularia collo-cygni TaxID=112498 RepID=A0A2D3UYW8_9PEZI|nr:uncharacterized protein RCC_04244 [Ramularia collo-cygni]CZT18400.1 uncharacterized protein RCC_04244 [Ramularia collo-cygni]
MTDFDSPSQFFDIEGGPRIHYTQNGNPAGPLLICLHGLGGSLATFVPLLPHLPSDKYNIVSVDFEGFGKTALVSEQLSVQNYVEDLALFVTHLQSSSPTGAACSESPIIIIGHSLGSIVALHYTAQYPCKVSGLGLLGVGRSASHIAVAKQRMLRLAERVKDEGIESAATLAMSTNFAAGEDNEDGRREFVRREVLASDPKAYAMVCETTVSLEHVDPDFARIKCPVVFISGQGDVISPPGKAREISYLLSGKTVVEVVRGGHQPILSDLHGTADALAELFRMVKT